MKEMFKFANNMLKFTHEMAELKYSNKWLKQELSNSVNKQDILECLIITNDGVIVKTECYNKIKRLLGVEK